MISNAGQINKKANIYFGTFLLIWSTFWLDEIINGLLHSLYISEFIRLLQFLTPLTFYISVTFYINPDYKYSVKDVRHLIALLLYFTFLLSRQFIPAQLFSVLYIMFFLSYTLLYILLAYFQIQRHQKNIEIFSSNKEFIDLRWLKYIIYSSVISSLLIAAYSVFFFAAPLSIYINLFFLAVVYLVAFYAVKQKEIYPKGLDIEQTIYAQSNEQENSKPKNKLIDDSDLNILKEKLTEVMEQEELYLDSELNLIKLAQKINVTSHQLSYVINNGFGENFFNFINKYRVQKAMKLLTDKRYDNLTIVAIGFESGFNSKTSFNTTFKKTTSHSPTQYRRTRSAL